MRVFHWLSAQGERAGIDQRFRGITVPSPGVEGCDLGQDADGDIIRAE